MNCTLHIAIVDVSFVFVMTADGLNSPSLYPMSNTYIPFESTKNVTYTCTASAGYQLLWELNQRQVLGDTTLNLLQENGIHIDTDQGVVLSRLVVTPEGRDFLNGEVHTISVQCLAFSGTLNFEISQGDIYHIIQFSKF